MTFAEDAEIRFTQIISENRNNMFHNLDRSHKGEPMVIKYLWHLNKSVSPKEIADSLQLSSARIAAILGNLEKKDEIIRNISPQDRRKIEVSLTAKGKKQAQMNFQHIRQKIIAVFNQMGETETDQFVCSIEAFLLAANKVEKEEGRGHF